MADSPRYTEECLWFDEAQNGLRNFLGMVFMPQLCRLSNSVNSCSLSVRIYPTLDEFHEWKRSKPWLYELQESLMFHENIQLVRTPFVGV